MSPLEYALASGLLRALGIMFGLLPARPDRVVLATARTAALDGNLLHLHRAFAKHRPDLTCITLLEPYGYGVAHRLAYLGRLVRGMYHLRTAALFVVDNAYLPIHVAPHDPRTTVVQVWHAVGALKRFGHDTASPPSEPERTFLHRHYDYVVAASEASRVAWSAAFRTPVERVLALGAPRTDFFFDPVAVAAACERLRAAYPVLVRRRVVLYAPTFRGRGRSKRPAAGFDPVQVREALGPDVAIVLKSHPNLDPALVPTQGFDVVADPHSEMNDWLALADVLVTDYSSSILEYSLLRRPIVLLVDDLAQYEADPGLYVDYRTEMIGTQVFDTDGVIAAIRDGRVDVDSYESFIERHLGASDGHASERFVKRFAPRA
ncbi:MAG: CDP-glycerol glycerophosphotransferase family protein [Chloroflexota bacterium]